MTQASEYDYELPAELIAQAPAYPRDACRLCVVHRDTGSIEHRQFKDLLCYLRPTDVVVLNDTRVLRARLVGRKEGSGGRVEVLLLEQKEAGLWEAMVSPGRRVGEGDRLAFGDGTLRAEVVARGAGGTRLVRVEAEGELEPALAAVGQVPLPPYIRGPLADESQYQTVYAQQTGASAAPTAGLHFTAELLKEVRARVAAVAWVTLHIGLGTFRPIRTARVEDHRLHAEWFAVPSETARLVNLAHAQGRRVLAVGTSTLRALEAAADEAGQVHPSSGRTELYIVPGYCFRVVEALLTNFHLPRSTLLVLVCALAGRELMLEAYRQAVAERYRFLSFGDAMLIL